MDNYYEQMFEYEKEEQRGIVIFKLVGNLDIGTVSSITAHVDSLISHGRQKFLFDFHGLERIDSSGIAAVIVLFKRVRSNNGDMKISRLRGQPREIFNLLRLDRVFESYDDLDGAIESFQ